MCATFFLLIGLHDHPQMPIMVVGLWFITVIWTYFKKNPLRHGKRFIWRRFINWFPLGMTYAFLYMGRYNLTVSKTALGEMMPISSFGDIFAVGTIVYGLSFLINGPLVDKWGGKRGIVLAALGAAIANGMMGVVTYLFLHKQINWNLTTTFSVLFGLNMYFQSFGAVSIIKVKAYWFHVRERGVFGAIFGTLISFGAYFAFDWGGAIVKASQKDVVGELNSIQQFLRTLFAVDLQMTDATWMVFLIPSFILIIWAIVDLMLIKDTPKQANFDDFDPHDASSGEDPSHQYTVKQLLTKIFSSPVILTIAMVEFTSGVIRNGIMQWYTVFAKDVPQIGAEFFTQKWGLLLMVAGITGGFLGGWISDSLFHSRRGPPAAIMNVLMFMAFGVMAFSIGRYPWAVGFCAVFISAAVIAVHSLMSGTAAADLGGRRATATASGVVDGFVYLGSGLQSFMIGRLVTTTQSGGWGFGWGAWPLFIVPFTVMGLFFAARLWGTLPEATKKYLREVENIDMDNRPKRKFGFSRKKTT
jgi:OPA family glycerol-3-phosphate transporter-like MFS transporter